MNAYEQWTATPGIPGEALENVALSLKFEGMGAQVCGTVFGTGMFNIPDVVCVRVSNDVCASARLKKLPACVFRSFRRCSDRLSINVDDHKIFMIFLDERVHRVVILSFIFTNPPEEKYMTKKA